MHPDYIDTQLDVDTAQKLYWGKNIRSIKADLDPRQVFSIRGSSTLTLEKEGTVNQTELFGPARPIRCGRSWHQSDSKQPCLMCLYKQDLTYTLHLNAMISLRLIRTNNWQVYRDKCKSSDCGRLTGPF